MLKNYTKVKIDEYGNKCYLNDEGERHRLNGPAFEYSSGSKFWYINDKEHRNIDHADEYSNEEKYWCFKGKRHRVGGSCSSTRKYWCVKGKGYTKQGYYNIVWDI